MKERKINQKFFLRGFTLIEILVVILIISIFSMIVFAFLNSARLRARDTERVQDLTQIMNALELYYTDNGHYPLINPPPAGYGVLSEPTPPWAPGEDWSQLAIALKPYISSLAVDPINKDIYSGSCFLAGAHFYSYYNYDGTDQHYGLYASLENPKSNKNNNPASAPCCQSDTSKCMYNEKNGGFGFTK